MSASETSIKRQAIEGLAMVRARLRVYATFVRPETLPMPLFAVVTSAMVAAHFGSFAAGRVALAGATLATLNAASNVLNQCFDVDADRINKWWRPLPAGRATPTEALGLAGILYAVSLATAWLVGATPGSGNREVFGLVSLIAVATVIYSVPPIRTKRNAWAAQVTIAAARGVLLPLCGWACVSSVARDIEPWAFGLIFGLFMLGASATKDFADVQGDAASGCLTLPVRHGKGGAARRIAPFLVAPWLLLPLGAWFTRPDGRPVLGGDRVALTILGIVLALSGWRIGASLMAETAETVPRNENHPAWRGIYRMTVLAYVGIVFAYLI